MPESITKVWRVNDSAVAAFCGDVGWLKSAREWSLSDMLEVPRPRFKDAQLMVFWPARIVEYDEDTETDMALSEDYYAWGSGKDFALGALATGADAVEAVRVAMLFDPGTSGTIRALPVLEAPLLKVLHG